MCLIFHMRFINNNINNGFRIFCRHTSQKRYQIFACGHRTLLRRSCLSTDRISFYTSRCSGSFFYGCLHILTDQTACLIRNGLFHYDRLIFLYNGTIFILNLFDNVRLVIISSIDKGTKSRCHLNHRYSLGLSKTACRKFYRIQFLFAVNQSCCLTRQIDSGFLSKSKDFVVLTKIGTP